MSEQPIRITETPDGRLVPGVIRQLTTDQQPRITPDSRLKVLNERDRRISELESQLTAAKERVKQLTERAVRAEKVVAECEASGFVTKDGTARKVNGTLCLDDDGVIVADGATVYFVDEFGDIVEYDCRGIEGGIPSGLFWSTREALEVARKQGGRA